MKLESQVVSLELAKELKENGYPQKGLWWWVDEWGTEVQGIRWHLNFKKRINSMYRDTDNREFEDYVAPTLAEWGEVLPPVIRRNNKSYTLNTFPEVQFRRNHTKWSSKGFWCGYYIRNDPDVIGDKFSLLEADARAKMWLYLKKNRLLEAQDG